MLLNYDLHCHSTASDGALSPREVVQRARSQGVDVLALTDHDVTAGLGEARAAAVEVGICLIPGVEISVTWNGITVHILGLGVDAENDSLQQGLRRLREFREWRATEIARRLDQHGISGAYEGAKKFSSGTLISRTHFAHYLIEQGHARHMRDVFKRFLVHNKPGYVAGEWAELSEAVDWIRQAGGQAVVAHPARYKISATKLRQFLEVFKACGGEGVEVVSSSHTPSDCANMARYARQFGLLASRGSDYHGPQHNWIELGKIPPLPDQCVPIWNDWRLSCGESCSQSSG